MVVNRHGDITYVPQKAVKGHAFADFLVAHPLPTDSPLSDNLPNEELFLAKASYDWKMHFDGAFQFERGGVGVVFSTLRDDLVPLSISLLVIKYHNEAEFQILIIGLEIASHMNLKYLIIYEDSELVIMQLKGVYDVQKDNLKPYFNTAKSLMAKFEEVVLEYLNNDDVMQLFEECPPYPFGEVIAARKVMQDSSNSAKPLVIKEKEEGEECIDQKDVNHILKEVHAEVCGMNQFGPKLYNSIIRIGYYWPHMSTDSLMFWGMDTIGPIDPPSLGHVFILATTNYFSKWAEVIPLKKVLGLTVANFVHQHIIYRFGVPDRITSNNGPQFGSHHIDPLVNQFRFKWKYSTVNHLGANGLVEALNKTLCDTVRKFVSNTTRDWHERLPKVLWASRIPARGPTQSTPYSLAYGGEVVLPLEIQFPSLRIALHDRMTNKEQAIIRCQELDDLDEKRL
ncbi:uncharacterized protein LOC105420587 [Amborella trichopoda]|uniref:uncharacterized protein LOC105420587 n=1 Tax=Amborella trichopoda TaxID=13333 RepID=UPI0005D38ACA|nr:uncharacterized protein LOC105420587 [Amborella trichopoda]|eukprot:XP_011623001.1 uncharacterized protein LOC105420587 [Amborella trichopoda]